MSIYKYIGQISETSPASASTAIAATTVVGFEKFHEIHIEADLLGATGGALDIYLQRKLATNLWRDWVHFSQLAAGASAIKLSIPPGYQRGITVVGGGTDAAPGVALAAGQFAGCHPGAEVRAVFVAGVSTSAGAAQLIRFYGLRW